MKGLTVDESLARDTIERTLNIQLVQHDANQRDRLYDLRLGPEGSPRVAVEVTQAADQLREGGWAAALRRGDRIPAPAASGRWIAVLRPSARQTGLATRLIPMMVKAETKYPELLEATQEFSSLMDAITLDRLGVSDLYRMPSDSTRGSLTFQMTPVGGAIERDPAAFVSWVGTSSQTPGDPTSRASSMDCLPKLRNMSSCGSGSAEPRGTSRATCGPSPLATARRAPRQLSPRPYRHRSRTPG